VTVTAPHAADADTGWAWKSPFLQVFSMTWKPWHLIAVLPPGQKITTPDGAHLTLDGTGMRGSLMLVPGLDLALHEAVVEGGALRLTSDRGWTIGAERVVLAAGADPSWANGLRLGVQATRLQPDPALTALVPDLGPVIEDLHLDATLQLTAPVDRHLADAPQGVTALHLNEAHVAWGPLLVSAKGNLTRAADGFAQGEIAINVAHWQRLPDALVASGLMPAKAKALVTRALTLLAAGAANPDQLVVPLVMKDGRMALGALPLGPAPILPQGGAPGP
jgi:hypothetical protein